jgi:predicted Rossmann fold nucleotide-binding protein DprA/Smf involved in DNA uptake
VERRHPRNPAEVLRDEMIIRERIIDLLREEPRTIPEISEALGHPSHEVMMWVMAMRRYGILIEIPKSRADDYYHYTIRSEGAYDEGKP